MSAAAVPRKKRLTKAAKAGLFYVAPTTPFIPKNRPSPAFAVKSAPASPSAHLVDLRGATASRPIGSPRQEKKKEKAFPFAQIDIPRTISHNPDRAGIWNRLALVAFIHFLVSSLKLLGMGLARLAALPITAALAVYDRFDADRSLSFAAKSEEPARRPQKRVPDIGEKASEGVFSRPKRHFSLKRALVSFAGTSLAIILPLQGMNAWKAVNEIKERALAARSASLSALHGTGQLKDAQYALSEARESVEGLGRVANAILENAPAIGGQFRSGKALLEAGDDLSTAAVLLSKSLDFMNDKSLDLTEKIAKAQDLASRAEPLLASAETALEKTGELPEEVGGDIVALRAQVAAMHGLASGFLSAAPALREMLGESQPRRYLVLFQNNAELRPTGGFIGSFAVVDVNRGSVTRVEVPAGGPYDLQGSLKTNVLAPEPLRLISSRWEFQDGNWFPDFASSAKKLSWFYGKSGGPSTDGVIAINAPVLADLLDVVGPINMPAYKTVATGTTVLATAQEIVESDEARRSGKPKQFIADLLPLVLDKIISAGGAEGLEVIKTFAQALEEKDIQAYFEDENAQAAFSRLGWTGEISRVPVGFDSLSLVRTNIAGGKTDTSIDTSIRQEIAIAADGTVTERVAVKLDHKGKKGEKFTGVRNVSYLRLYVPEGSKLKKAAGDIKPPSYSFFDLPAPGCVPDGTLAAISGPVLHDPASGTAINNEFGRTVFGTWTQTDPGQSSTVYFEYELPFKVLPKAGEKTLSEKLGLSSPTPESAAFGLVIGKQSGAENTEIVSTLKLPEGWYPALAAPEGIAEPDGWSYASPINSDKAIGMIISR